MAETFAGKVHALVAHIGDDNAGVGNRDFGHRLAFDCGEEWIDVIAAREKNLFLERQLREMMGAERDRIAKVWLVDSPEPVAPAVAAAVAARPAVVTYRVDRAALARWLEPEAGHTLEEHLYIVDPLGNWMMRTPANPDPVKLKKDVDRLLRASAWWNRAKDAR